MRPTNAPLAMPRRPGFADVLLGTLGAAAIRAVLTTARLWARLSGKVWHD